MYTEVLVVINLFFQNCEISTLDVFFQNGTLLLSQVFSEDPVVSMRCRTFEPPRHQADAEKVPLTHS